MPVIGIDLGTSNSVAAVLCGGRPVMVPSAKRCGPGGLVVDAKDQEAEAHHS